MSGIRETFYRDLAAGYLRDGERSFLYRYFWRESARELLEKLLPRAEEELPGPGAASALRARLAEVLAERPELKRLLLPEPPADGRRERRDFWQELVLADAGYTAGMITDTELYVWTARYLSARDTYYKDSGPWDSEGPVWLRQLLTAGLGREIPGYEFTKARAERDLEELTRLLDEERASGQPGPSERLHGLRVRTGRGYDDYLTHLTARLERAALHVKIRTYLQDSGNPLRTQEGGGAQGGRRKQDFSMRLFDAFCSSPEGYSFGGADKSGWRIVGEGFCVLDVDRGELSRLVGALERRDGGGGYIYIPLAVHLHSGCVFFLAGRGIYDELYERAGGADPRRGGGSMCFDYLRLDKGFWTASKDPAGGPFRLRPTFHENMGRSYSQVLDDFKRYCVAGVGSALSAVRELNESLPKGAPEGFRWAFEPPEETPEPSREARAAFLRDRKRAR